MKSSKKIMLVAAVLLLAAALFVGAGAAADQTAGTQAELEAAITNVGSNETITLTASFETSGIVVPTGKDFTLEFNGNTLTFKAPGNGSSNTKTIGFQLIEGSDITFQNGTINIKSGNENWSSEKETAAGGKPIKMLIQNYANLTLSNMTLDATNINHQNSDYTTNNTKRYALSNNQGPVSISNTNITVPSGDFVFDVCKFQSYDEPSVTVNGGTFTGKIEYSLKAEEPQGCLDIKAGTFIGDIVIASGAATPTTDNIKIEGGSFTVSSPATKNLIDAYKTPNSTATTTVGQTTKLNLEVGESFTLFIPATFNFVKSGDSYVASADDVGVTNIVVGDDKGVSVSVSSARSWVLSGLTIPYSAMFGETNMKNTSPFINKVSENTTATMMFTQTGTVGAGTHTDTLTFTAVIE